MEDTSQVFKNYPTDSTLLCMSKRHILEIFEEVNRCEFARKGMLNLIKAADAK